MECVRVAVAVGVVLVSVLSIFLGLRPQNIQSNGCHFPAIYNFGDSNSDTGALSAVFSPYGNTFFGKPSGRFSDERLIIDFMDKSSYFNAAFPRPEDFSKALYTLDIGQNDLNSGLMLKTVDQVLAFISVMTAQLALTIEQLYQQGGRAFWIHNTGPLGCLPLNLAHEQPKLSDLDRNGCLKHYDEVAQEFNRQLKERVLSLRAHLADAAITYVDLCTAKYTLISEAEKYGFNDPLDQCCGSKGASPFQCEVNTTVNGAEIFGGSCSNPSQYISWDSVHYSEAANKWVAKRILAGLFLDPLVSISEARLKHI